MNRKADCSIQRRSIFKRKRFLARECACGAFRRWLAPKTVGTCAGSHVESVSAAAKAPAAWRLTTRSAEKLQDGPDCQERLHKRIPLWGGRVQIVCGDGSWEGEAND